MNLNKRGFTLTEIMIVVVVLGVLAGLAIPNFFKSVEKARESEARTSLKTLHMGQKIYRVDNNRFFGPESNLDTINTQLNVELEEEFYDIAISAAATNTYAATATRINDANKIFTITQTGDITGG